MSPELPAQPAPIPLRAATARHARVALPVPVAFANLPQPLTSLIGRESDVAAAGAMLRDDGVRLLTLTGPGGVGKTRLALRIGEEAAEAFPDGVVFVPLAAIADADHVLPAIARELGLRDAGTRFPAQLVTDFLRGRQLLLLLDNFEQVHPAATQLAALLAACPAVTALVTSRAPLRIAGEQRFPVAPLLLPASPAESANRAVDPPLAAIAASPAVQLYIARAQAVEPRFALDLHNAVAVAGICRRLDGLPLAIELAAARGCLLSPGELLARLSPSLLLLTGGPADAPDRLRTMRDAIAWSHDLLSTTEQALFRRLAIFVGGFTVAAAEKVAEGERGEGAETADASSVLLLSPLPPSPPFSPSTLDLLTSLVEASLLRRTETSGETRFEMLETIREFGLEWLAASGELDEVARRHASWFGQLADRVRQSGQLSQGRGLVMLETEHPNLRAALTWLLDRDEATDAMHLAGQLAEFWMRHGHWAEGGVWLERALAAGHGESSVARAEALTGLNMMLWPRAEFARAEQLLGEAESIARAAGDAGALAYARLHQGYVALFRGDLNVAVARGEESLAAGDVIPQEFSLNGARWLVARAALLRGDDGQAMALYERLLAAARAGGDEISLANGLVALAILAERHGEVEQALAGFAEAAAVCRGFGDRSYASYCLDGMAINAVALRRPEAAVRLFAAAHAMRATTGEQTTDLSDRRREDHERAVVVARETLGTERFAAAWAAGGALSLDEAFAEATDLALRAVTPDQKPPRAGAVGLTAREREVLRHLILGWTDKEIAAALGIGRRTVSNHVATIRAKLDAPSRTAAAAVAIRDRLV